MSDITERPLAKTVGTPTDLLDSALVLVTTVLVIFGVLAFGAVENWSLLILQAGASCLFLLWVTKQVLQGSFVSLNDGLYAPVMLFASIVAVQILFRSSAYWHNTWSKALCFVVYGALFLIAVESFRLECHLKKFAFIISVFGFLLALFAIVQDLTSNGKIYWVRKLSSDTLFFGPYVNHNHYAGLMELITPIPLVLAFNREWGMEKRVLLIFAAVIMGSSIFLSKSRGGMVAFTAEILVFAIVLFSHRRTVRGGMALFGVCAVLMLFVLWVDTSHVVSRISSLRDPLSEGVSGHRLTIVRDGLKMFIHKPMLGWGLGVFPTVYPQYRSFYTNLFINDAHNDYLQILVETGILGFGAVVWFLLLLYRRGLRSASGWQRSLGRGVRLGAMLGCTGLLVHSFTDFNFQIPANAAMFCVLAGIAMSTVVDSPRATLLIRTDRERRGAM